MATSRTQESLRSECLRLAGILDALQVSLTQPPKSHGSAVQATPSIGDLKRYCHWLELQKSLDSLFADLESE